MSESIRTPLGKVRGLGSAKEGVGHFVVQRVTAIALVFLLPWFLISILLVAPQGYAAIVEWVALPWNAVLIVLTMAAALNHMRLGVQVIVEDYIHKSGTKIFLLILNTFICVALFAAAAFAVLKIAG
jgi:succinate dehydrogenase / fumarate reductase membrane anchor subunit